jgi:ATP-dependent helicase/nuclease subunit A
MMDAPLSSLDDPNESQRGASDPTASIWVAASAGTGKTKVLTDRVLRLMLAGTEPRRILCLTYTKAAAAEMANRIAERLGDWATAADEKLRRKLIDLLGRQPTDEQRQLARQLFARVLDAPGGLNIQTIHAFCQSLLARFPLEAGVAPHSTVMEERDAEDLLTLARQLAIEAADRDGALAGALAVATRHLREGRFADLMTEIAKPPVRLSPMIEAHGSVDRAAAAMREMLGVARNTTPAAVVAAACATGTFDVDGLRRAASALACGSPAECERAAIIHAWLAADPATKAETFDRYASVFLTKDKEVRASLINKKTAAACPGALEALQQEAERLVCVMPKQRAAVTAEASEALLILGQALMRAYRRLKDSRALLDYGDLIEAAARLLRGEGNASWVLFKLDGGIDHVLIDEAQDTAPDQWEVIRSLSEEFFAGEGARDVLRTVFAVGDVKQSIFSFQGADPASFLANRKWFAERVPKARWRPIELKTSFRSTRAVLQAVDQTFADPEMARSIALEPDIIVHQAYRKLEGGSVELWPPVAAREPEQQDPWTPPVERLSADSPQSRLALLIAARIETMLRGGESLESKGRPIVAGDVMVLVRRRTPFMQALVRALKERQLPVAGVDRMLLTEQLAVMDLMALGRFALLPEDDLTLATVLKGPLVGLDEDQLFALAHGRAGSLWRALRDGARNDDSYARAHRWLSTLLAVADAVPPFEFFMRALGPASDDTVSGRRKLLSRLGREADDPITEFLEMALAYERVHAPSLQGFLHWLERSDVEVKRDPEHSRQNAVRVMTVHGAKGLQAPIVFLPDTCQMRDVKENVLWMACDDGRKVLVWPPRSEFRDPIAEAERRQVAARQMQEYRRLLYVAMTRASDRLIVCGWLNRKQKKGPPQQCWYSLVRRGLETKAHEVVDDPFLVVNSKLIESASILRVSCPQLGTPERHATMDEEPPPPLPAWATRPAPAEPPPARPLRPSHADRGRSPFLAPLADAARFQRGRLIHRLLQELPEIAPAARGETARRWLARRTHRLTVEAQATIAAEVMAVMQHPRMAALFGPGSRAEVPLSGEIDGQLIAGQIDRLCVEADEVIVLDYKSDRPAPCDAAAVPPAYLRQMAAYRALLRHIYPGRLVRCLLLWTEEPRPMTLDDTLLDRHAPAGDGSAP